jgi:RHS repeat-associated protein
LARNTGESYDALNRLSQVTDPNGGKTIFGYDGNDNLISVQDPLSFTTTYQRNGFGDVTTLVSPDTGTTVSTYDSGGNLSTATDARSAKATYSYDALNRLTKQAYTDQTISFTYDAGTNGKGRLTGASDAYHSMSWVYDALGRVTGKGQTVGSVTKSVGYSFTNNDLVKLVTPSGQTITYTYTNHQITQIAINGTTLLSGVTYFPYGPVSGWTWGNGTTASHTYDQDGNPATIVTAATTNTYTVDAASRITGLSDSTLSSNSWTFGYDLLDRVTSGSSSAKSRGYTYDANGNRLTTTGTTASTETISTTSNQLNATSGGLVRTYAYDKAGNTLSFTGNTFTYDQRGRMLTAATSAGTTTYTYNALGQLIEKSGNGGTTLLMYDEAGHILGEYGSTGTLIQETVWMGDTPVATIRPNGTTSCTTTVCVFYVHSDHLNSPRKVTRTTDNGLMWRWDPDTFGSSTSTPNGNPANLGAFVYNLRYPGQYFLAETGLSQNYFRDYDPAVGRYLESDPIGLAGGINTYSYAQSNPVSLSDPTGTQVVIPVSPLPPPVAPGAAPGTPPLLIALINAGQELYNIIGDTTSAAGEAVGGAAYEATHSSCPPQDPCKGLRDQLKAHQEKLRNYMANPLANDNTGILGAATLQGQADRAQSIYAGRILSLNNQIANFKKLLAECEAKHGK